MVVFCMALKHPWLLCHTLLRCLSACFAISTLPKDLESNHGSLSTFMITCHLLSTLLHWPPNWFLSSLASLMSLLHHYQPEWFCENRVLIMSLPSSKFSISHNRDKANVFVGGLEDSVWPRFLLLFWPYLPGLCSSCTGLLPFLKHTRQRIAVSGPCNWPLPLPGMMVPQTWAWLAPSLLKLFLNVSFIRKAFPSVPSPLIILLPYFIFFLFGIHSCVIVDVLDISLTSHWNVIDLLSPL